MTLSPTLYYLADRHDRFRLMADGSIQAAHVGTPWYFSSEDSANAHDDARGLTVFSVPAAETIPGAPKGTRIEDAVAANDVYRHVAMVEADKKDVYRYVAMAVADEVAKLCQQR